MNQRDVQDGKVLTPRETKMLLDQIPEHGMREPVAIVDRRHDQEAGISTAMLVERDRLVARLDPKDPADAALLSLLDPVQWPFFRVIVCDLDGATYALRICRMRRGPNGQSVGLA